MKNYDGLNVNNTNPFEEPSFEDETNDLEDYNVYEGLDDEDYPYEE